MMNSQPTSDIGAWYKKLVDEGPVKNIESLVHEPLGSGYFFRFCRSEFCAETIDFIIEVDKYIELFSADEESWDRSKSWKEIDEELSNSPPRPETDVLKHSLVSERLQNEDFIPAESWPSEKIDRLVVQAAVRSIWARFLADDAVEQVCLPARVVDKTIKRLFRVGLYGKELFQEACRDRGILTTQKDIAMRFLKTEDYRVYLQRLQDIQNNRCSVSIHIPAPRNTLTITYTKNQLLESESAVPFTLDEVLKDGFLYGEFMKYLARAIASEHLRFARANYVFQRMVGSTEAAAQRKVSDWAFKMYQNFIVPGSVYEICCAANVRKDIARSIAVPHKNMFEHPARLAMTTLKQLYEAYQATPEYAALRGRIVENFDAMEAVGPGVSSGNSVCSFNTVNSKATAARLARQGSANSNHSSSSRQLLPNVHMHSPGMSRTGSSQGIPRTPLLIPPAGSMHTPHATPTSHHTLGTLGTAGITHGNSSSSLTPATSSMAIGHAHSATSALSSTPTSGHNAAASTLGGTGNTPVASRSLPAIGTGAIEEDEGDSSERSQQSKKVKSAGFLHLPIVNWFGVPR
jgi:hypothetical protein